MYYYILLMNQFYPWEFDILNDEIFINEFQIIYEFQYSVVSSFIVVEWALRYL